jgi:acyl carrier protein
MNIERLRGVFREVFENPTLEITPATTARDVENWDSFNHINLVIAIETEYGVKFKTKEIKDMANVGDLVTLLRAKGVEIDW